MRYTLFYWTPKQATGWQQMRQRGKWYWIVWRWVIGWGGVCAIIDIAFVGRMRVIDLLTVLVTIVIWTLAGLVAGRWLWAATERTYHHYLQTIRPLRADTAPGEHVR